MSESSSGLLPEVPFCAIADLVRDHAAASPQRAALVQGGEVITWAELDALMDRVAASLQRDGARHPDVLAMCTAPTLASAVVFLGALRAGVAVAPLAPSVTREAFASMVRDANPRWLFVDGDARALADAAAAAVPRIALDAQAPGHAFGDWLLSPGARPQPVAVQADWAFNIIYSSGTTGTPKGIVQPHGMRWAHVRRGADYGYGPEGVTLLATPLYSNTTLVVFFPTIAFGGTVVLMRKFDAAAYLSLAQQHHATHTMLVPVQYQRLMARPDFDDFDLSSFRFKFCTSAPFPAALKADVLARWPGGLVEFYGMTEGGGTCILRAHEHPHKLHTVGQPAEGHDVRLIDESGGELPRSEIGEVVGRSPAMMTGYHGQPAKTREAEWFDSEGQRFIRTGDVGRFDEDGFLVLMDRRKDMIISGGFNIYPSDLEAVLRAHPAVGDVAVVGIPSEQWGESPLACVVPAAGASATSEELLAWANARVGKTQRLVALHWLDELPRSAIGKVLKRELREQVLGRREAGRH